ncbi:MAG: WD40 repeat domain-containing protein [Planctomycetaceae bacterium]
MAFLLTLQPLVASDRPQRLVLAALVVSLAGGVLGSDDEPRKPRIARSDDGPLPIATFSRFPDWVASVAFAPGGATLAAGSYGIVKLFDTATLSEIAAIDEPAGLVRALAFSVDGKSLAGGTYQAVSIWAVADRKRLHTLKGHRGQVNGVAFSPDGKLLATASDDETARLWDVGSGEPRQTAIIQLEQPALAVTFAPDGLSLAVATGDPTRPTRKGLVQVFDLAGRPQKTFDAQSKLIGALAYSPQGNLLATGSADETIRLYDLAGTAESKPLEGHTRPVNSLAFAADGAWLVSGSGGRNLGGNELKLWELSTGKDRLTIAAHEAPVRNLAVSDDGRFIATASLDKSVKLWDLKALLAAATKAAGGAKPQEPR